MKGKIFSAKFLGGALDIRDWVTDSRMFTSVSHISVYLFAGLRSCLEKSDVLGFNC